MDTLRYKQLDSLSLVDVKRELAIFMEHAERMNWHVSDETIGYMNQLDRVIKALSQMACHKLKMSDLYIRFQVDKEKDNKC